MANTARKLVVCGGNGFVGSHVCRAAVARGWNVTSISGAPAGAAWTHQVAWERADVFHPETYRALFQSADYVVHTMGILLEADYKGLLRGQSPKQAIQKWLQSSPSPEHSYERMNRDSALETARVAAEAGVGAYAFLSAATAPPGYPRYLSTKREAEKTIAAEHPTLRSLMVRAPVMYDSARQMTLGAAALSSVGSLVDGVTRGALGSVLGTKMVPPLPVETVAQAVVEGLAGDAEGILEPRDLQNLAARAWRQTML